MLQIKITVIEIKNAFDRHISLLDTAKKIISGLEDRSIENPQTEIKREKNVFFRKDPKFQEQLDNLKRHKIDITGIPDGEERENRAGEIFEIIIAVNFLKSKDRHQNVAQEHSENTEQKEYQNIYTQIYYSQPSENKRQRKS